MPTAVGRRPPARVSPVRARPKPVEESRPLPGWAAFCFLVSGAAGLLYEVVWSKQLSYILGSSLHAIATVVAAFLCGLALGAWLLGARLVRNGKGPLVYARLELLIGALGLLSVPALHGLDPIVGALYRGFGGETAPMLLLRFAILFVMLLLPTLLMGATLPVLVGHFEFRVGPALARLYAINTLGAVLGSALGGFVLLPGVGLTATTWIAAALNLTAAAVAWRSAARAAAGAPSAPSASGTANAGALGGSASAPAKTAQRPSPAPIAAAPAAAGKAPLPPLLARGPRIAVAFLLALSGFAALAFQIAWVRLFGLLLGSSVYSFSAVLAVYLAALAAGSAAIARWLGHAGEGDARRLLVLLAVLELAIAIVTLAGVRMFSWLPEALFGLSQAAAGSWTRFYLGEIVLVALVVALPCLAFGAIFPVAARLLQTRDGGHATGQAFAVNTAGTLLGSLGAGFLLVPTLGVQGTHIGAGLVVALAGMLAALLAVAHGASRPRALGGAAATAGLAVAFAWSAPGWNPSLMSAGIYRPVVARQVMNAAGTGRDPVERFSRSERVLFYREGQNGSVYVATDSAGTHRWLKVGGKTDAGTADMLTQVLLGVLPLAFAPESARTAVIGLGSGITVAGALAAGAGPVEVIEIEPAVALASRFFHEPGHHPLDDPRVTLVLGDARTRLFNTSTPWDVIVSEPSNPWIAGVNNLFTVDFYRRLRSRLSPAGVFCQWLQLYELAPETLASLLRSYLDVFPHGHAFVIHDTQDLLLVATPPGDTLSLARLSRPEVAHWLARANQIGPASVAAWYACPFDSLRRLIGLAPLNRDDLPVVEYRASRDLYRIGRQAQGGGVTATIPSLGWTAAAAPFASWPPAVWFAGRARQLARSGNEAAARQAAAEARHHGLPDVEDRVLAEIDAQAAARELARLKDQARLAASTGRWPAARDALLRAVALDPAEGETWVMLADAQRTLGDPAAAREAIARALATGDSLERGYARMVEGTIEMAGGRARQAANAFAEAARWQPTAEAPWVQQAQALRAAGDTSAAIATLREGLRRVAGGRALHGLLAEIETGRR